MKKITMLFLSLLISASVLHAQEQKDGPVLQYETTNHDFGKVHEENGPVSYVFKFKNTGNKPLTLTNVHPACGCTTSDWTKGEVAPGAEGYIKATYDVNNRPGPFHKSVTVYSNGEPSVSLITFSGEVIPRPKTIEDSFPYPSGSLRFEQNHVNYGALVNNIKDTTQYINIVNTSDKPVTIKEVKSSVPRISSNAAPLTIQPKQRVKFPITYHANLVNDYGLIFDQVKLITNDENEPEKTITVLADVKQYFPPMTDAEKAKAPKIFFPTTSHDFGTIKEGESVTTDFEFTNKGKQSLMIYKVKTSCGCTASQPEKNKLKPGETSKIKVTFNSTGKNGKEEKHITVYSNDPTNPEVTLTINSVVEQAGTDNQQQH